MAKQIAPVSLSGGQGFNYEDQVAARFLVDMLAGVASFGCDFGQIVRVDWQTRDAHRLLDDLAVTFKSQTGQHVAECSIKSDRQVTSGGFPVNFVEAAWEQWHHALHPDFNKERDLLVLVVGELANDVQESWSTLLRQSLATTNERFLERHKAPVGDQGSQSSETARSILKSLYCPNSLQSKGPSDAMVTVDLVRRIRLIHYDFESEPSRHREWSISDCQRLVRNSSLEEAKRLWISLVSIASELRGLGGSIDLPMLQTKLRPAFQLVDHPDYLSDWRSLRRVSTEILNDIRDTIGDVTTIKRDEDVAKVNQKLDSKQLGLLIGESGTGKSALAKSVAQTGYDEIVAITSEDCNVSRLSQLDDKLGISHPLAEVLRSSRGRCLLILDSLENFSDQALKIAAKVVRDVIDLPWSDQIHVLLVCQSDSAQQLIPKLALNGIDKAFLEPIQLSVPPSEAITPVLLQLSGLSWATLHIELRPLLRNLKILDWVVQASQAGQQLDSTETTGIISLIDYLWSQWIEGGDRGIAGGGLLKKIASMEATGLSMGVPLSRLDHSEQLALKPLLTSDLLKRKPERIYFSHDLLGDWARLRLLIGEDPTRSNLDIDRFASPRWHKALRLFGRWLLSQPEGIRRWSEAIKRSESSGSVGIVIRDQLLDSISLDENTSSLIKKALPTLCEDDGRLLKLLLDRFFVVATLPDLHFFQFKGDASYSSEFEATFRVPRWPYWGPMLTVLSEKIDVVSKHAPDEAIRISKLWLEKTPTMSQDGTSFPFRNEAAKISIAIGREYQLLQESGGYVESSDEKACYQAVLLAATEFPDEVASFALEMAKRKPLNEEMQRRTNELRAERERSRQEWERSHPENAAILQEHSFPELPMGERIGPWPDGPNEHVDSAFREAVLDGQGIVRLAEVRPDVVFEVLLAVSIEPPHDENLYGSDFDDSHGLESHWDYKPALYFRGPFLVLFRLHPEKTIDFAVKLVNFATARWTESEIKYRRRQRDRSEGILELIEPLEGTEVQVCVDKEVKTWLGDHRVFRWHLDWPVGSELIPCVLMALEKYLYEQLDGKIDIGPLIERILFGSQSVAFAGLLIDVGKRNPELFFSSLLPMFGTAEFYSWDHRGIVERRSGSAGMIGWWGQPKDFQDLAREWHLSDYRNWLLRDIAIHYMLSFPSLEAFFAECRARWNANKDAGQDSTSIKMLIAQLDRRNYREEPTEGNQVLAQFVPPPDIQELAAENSRGAENTIKRITFPMDCRRILDGEKTLPVDQCEAFVQSAIAMGSLPSQDIDDVSSNAAAIAGVIAVLVNLHFEWLVKNQDKSQWCIDTLIGLIQNPPARRRFEMPDTPGDWEWDCFAAEAAVGLLRQSQDHPLLREMVAYGVTAYRYGTTEKTMRMAYRYQDSLGENFALMQNLAIQWSLVRYQRTTCENFIGQLSQFVKPDGTDSETQELIKQLQEVSHRWLGEHQQLIDNFIQGTTASVSFEAAGRDGRAETATILDLRFPGRRNRSDRQEEYSRRNRMTGTERGIDGKVLQAAFAWLSMPLPTEGTKRSQHINHIRSLLCMVLESIPVSDEDDPDSSPGEFEGWVFGLASQTIVAMNENEKPAKLWEPILSLGVEYHYWIVDFFWQWFTDGARAAVDANGFCRQWSKMLEFALSAPAWSLDDGQREGLAEMVYELMGFHFGMDSVANREDFALEIERMTPLIDKAADKWFSMSNVVSGFARSLSRPAYRLNLCRGIQWLFRAMKNSNDYDFWWDRDMERNLTNALDRCWETNQESVRNDQELQQAFLGLLIALSSRGNHAAITLKDRLVSSIATI